MLRSVVNYANNSAGNVSGCERRSIHRLATEDRSADRPTSEYIQRHTEKGKSEMEGRQKETTNEIIRRRKGDVRCALNVTNIKWSNERMQVENTRAL